MQQPPEQSRAEFEAWISAPPYERSIERQGELGTWPGQYRPYETQAAWEAWQEARRTDPDAERYRKLRALAMQRSSLEAFVSLEMLDHLRTDEEFDRTINTEIEGWDRG